LDAVALGEGRFTSAGIGVAWRWFSWFISGRFGRAAVIGLLVWRVRAVVPAPPG
jgi:hypothetical protein